MPKKIRQLKAILKKAGFHWRPGKGSHTVWRHDKLPGKRVTVSGNDGDDAKKYQERDVEEAIREVEKQS
jgi:predicted RNA binding protein YcfA (HicA-like mRNA interferase family)